MKLLYMGMLSCLLFISGKAEAVLASANHSTFAYCADSIGAITNPAGAVTLPDRLDVSVRWLNQHKRGIVKGSQVPGANGNFNASTKHNFYFWDYGLNKHFQTYICDRCIDWSLSFVHYTTGFAWVSYDQPLALYGTTKAAKTILREAYSGVFSVRINCKHSVGFAIEYHKMHNNFKGFQNFDHPGVTVAPGHVTNNGYDHNWGVGILLGWRWQVTDKLAFGAVYRPITDESRFHKYKGIVPRYGRDNFAAKAGAGITYEFNWRFLMAFDAEWIDFKNVQVGHPLLDSQGGIPQLGSNNGSALGWRSTFFYRVGALYNVNECWSLKAAYIFTRGQTRRSQTLIGLGECSAVTDILSLATTYLLKEHHQISVEYNYGFQNTIKGKNSIPVFVGGGEASNRERFSTLSIAYGYIF